jgi:hypothetical protein
LPLIYNYNLVAVATREQAASVASLEMGSDRECYGIVLRDNRATRRSAMLLFDREKGYLFGKPQLFDVGAKEFLQRYLFPNGMSSSLKSSAQSTGKKRSGNRQN